MLLSAFGNLKIFVTGVKLKGMINIKKESKSANNILLTNTDVNKCLSKLVAL